MPANVTSNDMDCSYPLTKEWLELVLLYKNSGGSIDDCTQEFFKRYPEVKLESIVKWWVRPKDTQLALTRMQENTIPNGMRHNSSNTNIGAKYYKEQAEKIKQVLISIGLNEGDRVPFDVIARNVGVSSMTVRSYICGYTNEKDKVSSIFKDTVKKVNGSWIYSITNPSSHNLETDLSDRSVLMIPAKIKHKFDISGVKNNIIDDESMDQTNKNNLLAEQIVLLKEISSEVKTLNTSISTVLSRFDAAVEANKKK